MMNDMIERMLLDTSFEILPPRISATKTGQDQIRRRFDDYDFWYVRSGSCTIILNGERIGVSAKTLFIYRPGDVLSVLHAKNVTLTVYLCHFNPVRANGLFDTVLSLPRTLKPKGTYFERIFERAIAAEQHPFRSLSRDIFLRTVFLYLLTGGFIESNAVPDTRTKRRYDTFKRLGGYIDGAIDGNISIDALSAHAGLDRTTVIKLFSEFAGVTPHKYILSKRIDAAKQALAAGASISELCRRTGFADAPTFSKVFKKITGVTPRAYADRLREKQTV
ncbi:MAG: helix-turn-helix transcriptional regulator [Spirochaetes bacterium]|nr:helix-turn-helix transcriptional regulator [Spirochaetota bacterium]